MGVYEYPSEPLFTSPCGASPGVELLGPRVHLKFSEDPANWRYTGSLQPSGLDYSLCENVGRRARI